MDEMNDTQPMRTLPPVNRLNSLNYQDILRAIGAWLDVRGHQEVRIAVDRGTIVIEVVNGQQTANTVETLRLDHERIHRLRAAALRDRDAPRPLIPAARPTLD